MRIFLVFLLLCLAPAAYAGGKLMPQQFQGQQTLVVFWRADCAPCVQELAILPSIAKAHPELNLTLVSLQDDVTTRKHLPASWPASIPVIIAPQNNEALLKRFGDTRRALPFSVLLDEDGHNCAKHYGILGTQIVDDWTEQC